MSKTPCAVGQSRLATDRGLLSLEQLAASEGAALRVSSDTRVPSSPRGDQRSMVLLLVQRGITMHYAGPVYKLRSQAPVFRVTTEHGFETLASDDQEFLTPEGPMALRELKIGSPVLLQSGSGVWNTQDVPTLDGETEGWRLGLKEPGSYERLPESLWAAPRGTVVSFLKSFFTAQRSAPFSQSQILAGGARRVLRELQLLLLNEGIVSKITPSHFHHILILENHNRNRFLTLFGDILARTPGQETLEGLMKSILQENFQSRVAELAPSGLDDIYAVNAPETRSVIIDGFVCATRSGE